MNILTDPGSLWRLFTSLQQIAIKILNYVHFHKYSNQRNKQNVCRLISIISSAKQMLETILILTAVPPEHFIGLTAINEVLTRLSWRSVTPGSRRLVSNFSESFRQQVWVLLQLLVLLCFSAPTPNRRRSEAHVNEHCTSAKMLSAKQNFN